MLRMRAPMTMTSNPFLERVAAVEKASCYCPAKAIRTFRRESTAAWRRFLREFCLEQPCIVKLCDAN